MSGDARGGIDPVVGQAIEALIAEHAWLIDHGQADRLPDLYLNDARVLGIGPDKVGLGAIADWANERAAMTGRCSRHVQSNIRLVSSVPGEVSGTVVLTLYRNDGEGKGRPVPMMVAEYDDQYRLCPDGRWRFLERRLSVLFAE